MQPTITLPAWQAMLAAKILHNVAAHVPPHTEALCHELKDALVMAATKQLTPEEATVALVQSRLRESK